MKELEQFVIDYYLYFGKSFGKTKSEIRRSFKHIFKSRSYSEVETKRIKFWQKKIFKKKLEKIVNEKN